jgi:phospholipid transport system substrate-binding protein
MKTTTQADPDRPLNRARALLSGFAVMAALAAPAAATAQGTASANVAPLSAGAPDVLVRTVSNEVLDTIRADKALQSGDIAKLNELVDSKVLPYVDFEKMTRLTVGRAWRQASPEQRQALVREFRALLTYTYSGAMSQVSDHKVELRPFRAAPTDTDVIVRTSVVASKGEPIQLDYRMEKTDAGWKIYDFNILGVWLIENYRNSFASEVNAGGIDGLIKTLTDKNKRLAGGTKS